MLLSDGRHARPYRSGWGTRPSVMHDGPAAREEPRAGSFAQRDHILRENPGLEARLVLLSGWVSMFAFNRWSWSAILGIVASTA